MTVFASARTLCFTMHVFPFLPYLYFSDLADAIQRDFQVRYTHTSSNMWFSVFAQGRFDMWTGGAGNETADPAVGGPPALTPDPQQPPYAFSCVLSHCMLKEIGAHDNTQQTWLDTSYNRQTLILI